MRRISDYSAHFGRSAEDATSSSSKEQKISLGPRSVSFLLRQGYVMSGRSPSPSSLLQSHGYTDSHRCSVVRIGVLSSHSYSSTLVKQLS